MRNKRADIAELIRSLAISQNPGKELNFLALQFQADGGGGGGGMDEDAEDDDEVEDVEMEGGRMQQQQQQQRQLHHVMGQQVKVGVLSFQKRKTFFFKL